MKDSHDPTKTSSDICPGEPLGFKGRSNQKAYNHDDNFRWVTLKYVPALASALSLADTPCLTAAPHLKWRLHWFPSACRSSYQNLYKEMKFCRTLQNLVSLKGQLSVNESKLNHKGPLHSRQIVQLAVKSYLRLTGCDGQKWYMATIVVTAALFPQSCLHDAKVAINRRKPALRNIKLLVGTEGSGVLI